MFAPVVINFGCRLNSYESEIIQRLACDLGLSDYCIFNTCAVTAEAERQVKQKIRKVHKESPDTKIIVTGCASTYSPDDYLRMDGVVAVINNECKLMKESYQEFSSNISISYRKPKKVRSFLSIQNGCDNHCTYCIVKHTRGNSVSVKKEKILEEASKINDPEIVLTGVNITSYNDSGFNLTKLVEYLLCNLPINRLRLSSLDPADIDEDFINLFVNEKRILPHLHLSTQSGDDMILKRMRRRHNRLDVIKLANNILLKRPETILGADFITGFPTETDDMFENTCSFLKESNITLSHIFPYSERPGTSAALMPQVDKKVRKDRARKLISISKTILKEKLGNMIGSDVSVLAENKYNGKTDNFLSVKSVSPMVTGTVSHMRIVSVENDKLIAEHTE